MPAGQARQAVQREALTRELAGRPRRRKFRKPPLPLSTRSNEADHRRATLRSVEVLRELVDQVLIPALPGVERMARISVRGDASIRMDAPTWVPFIKSLLEDIRQRWRSLVLVPFELAAQREAGELSAKNLASIRRQMRSVLEIDVFMGEPELDDVARAFVEDNVALINGLSDDTLKQIEGLVLRGFRGGERSNSIADKIQGRLGVAESRARLIAVDQINKLNGDLTRNRQINLGFERYIWRTSRDEVVRPEHREREGRVFSWDDPPPDGHPGQPIRCRCHAEPVFDDLLP